MINLKKILADSLGIQLTSHQVEAFLVYERMLQIWNEKHNLTAIRELQEIRIKHFYDSLTCLKLIGENELSLIDVGCGAGFPGIPLKIVRGDIQLVLVDAVHKKTDFCSALAAELGLKDVIVLHERAETLGQDPDYREKFDWAVARAVAPLPVLAEYLLPLARPGGAALAQKGGSVQKEIEQSQTAMRLLGGELQEVLNFQLPAIHENRSLLKIQKISSTPDLYPRKAGIPAKKPLI